MFRGRRDSGVIGTGVEGSDAQGSSMDTPRPQKLGSKYLPLSLFHKSSRRNLAAAASSSVNGGGEHSVPPSPPSTVAARLGSGAYPARVQGWSCRRRSRRCRQHTRGGQGMGVVTRPDDLGSGRWGGRGIGRRRGSPHEPLPPRLLHPMKTRHNPSLLPPHPRVRRLYLRTLRFGSASSGSGQVSTESGGVAPPSPSRRRGGRVRGADSSHTRKGSRC